MGKYWVSYTSMGKYWVNYTSMGKYWVNYTSMGKYVLGQPHIPSQSVVTSANSTDPVMAYSSASQLQNINVLPGLHPVGSENRGIGSNVTMHKTHILRST